jgi:hypothetical protein
MTLRSKAVFGRVISGGPRGVRHAEMIESDVKWGAWFDISGNGVGAENAAVPSNLALRLPSRSTRVINLNTFRSRAS